VFERIVSLRRKKSTPRTDDIPPIYGNCDSAQTIRHYNSNIQRRLRTKSTPTASEIQTEKEYHFAKRDLLRAAATRFNECTVVAADEEFRMSPSSFAPGFDPRGPNCSNPALRVIYFLNSLGRKSNFHQTSESILETQVRTPQMVFMHPQRLVVPLFQRPYVWNEENQWEPLWNDVVRITERLLRFPQEKHYPHFLGAVVLQQVQNLVGTMQERTIIDGQQRLTTLQLLFDALHAELMAVNATAPAMRLESLVVNAEPFCRQPDDRFKVWPTNRDRPAFNAVMGATPPIDYDALGLIGERMVEAHRFFGEQAREWLSSDGPGHIAARAAAVETVVRDLLQMVVIDLGADENAQEIFETLNARGAQLTAADLIKNFIFQRLLESGADVEDEYERRWRDFESAFWEAEISVGRLRYPRSSLFLNHWLIARTGKEVVAREVFTRFKSYAFDVGKPMPQLLAEVDRAARAYRDFVQSGEKSTGPIDRLGLFGYRTGVLESEVIKPLVLYLLDPEQSQIPDEQLRKALGVIESWMVRRMLVRATTKSYNQLVAELITHLAGKARATAGDDVQSFLAGQTSDSRYWPDDQEIREELRVLPAYRRLGRGRLRMVLEAIEDHRRGWCGDQAGLGGGASRTRQIRYRACHAQEMGHALAPR
jgi:hypothetical protein